MDWLSLIGDSGVFSASVRRMQFMIGWRAPIKCCVAISEVNESVNCNESPWCGSWWGSLVKSKMLKIRNVDSWFSLNLAHDAHQEKSLFSTYRPQVQHISISYNSMLHFASWVNIKIISNFSLTWGWKTENHLMMKNRKSLSIQNAWNSKCFKFVLLHGNMCRLSVGFDAAGATLVGSRTRSKLWDQTELYSTLMVL